MHPSRRRKKRPNYGIRTVEVLRGSNGFGFTISGQQPCILSCIVANSPADHAGLRAGDFLISVNGISVSKITHDAVVNLIGNCVGPIRMTIAENYYSDSSEEELDVNRMVNSRKPKYPHKLRSHRLYKQAQRTDCESSSKKHNDENSPNLLNISNNLPVENEAGPVEYKALVGYLGTIEMPKQLLPNSRLQTVCSCIRKLRQEKRAPTAVLMTIFPTCLTLKNSSNHILAIYPTNRVVYVGSMTDRESRYFGLVTSAVNDTRNESQRQSVWLEEKKFNNAETEVEVSNSCHVFMIDPKIVEHSVHVKKAENFKFTCTSDVVTGNCLEFPRNALYIVNLVQNMYKLQNNDKGPTDDVNLGPVVANSPQPSASSNSDSGIGFRDDCGNISDRILVVEFPAHRPFPVMSQNNNRPSAIALESLDLPLNNDSQNYELNNIRCKNNLDIKSNNLSKSEGLKQMNNLNNIRACGSVNIKNVLEKPENLFLAKQNNNGETFNRLTCRAMPDRPTRASRGLSPLSTVSSSDNNSKTSEIEADQVYCERPVDVPENIYKKSFETLSASEDMEFKSSVDNISVRSSKSVESTSKNLFKTPHLPFFESKKLRKQSKMVNSCDNLDKFDDNLINYKLSPKVYGLSKPNYSCEELNNLDSVEKFGYGSLQEIYRWDSRNRTIRNIAQSEPDIRIQRLGMEQLLRCEQNGPTKANNSEGPAGWATSFEKLLEDPLGLHTFAEFLKKEFSAENIYFWTACERYRHLPAGPERIAEAQRIYQQHLCVGAPEGVNVDAHGRHCTELALQEPCNTLFNLAQKQIFNLMKFDSYPRFLKSTLYKQCLAGEAESPQPDIGLMLQPHPKGTPTKLKKSLSNAEDRRRKSLLPWHRKNRSKSKDRGESEYVLKRSDITSNESVNGKMDYGSDTHSSKSSLTSLDLAVGSNQDCSKTSQDEMTTSAVARAPLCRVLLGNESTTVVQIKDTETIQQLVTRLLDKRGLAYSAFEVSTDKHSKAINITEPSTALACCEVTVEQRVVFKIDLPNKKVISVKSKTTKLIVDVLRPILHRYGYNLDHVKVTFEENQPIDITRSVTTIDEKRLKVHSLQEPKLAPTIKVSDDSKTKLDEITNQVFEDILHEKADHVFLKPDKSDKGSVKSEDWGSEHSSGIFGRFRRRDSGLHERRKKFIPKVKPESGGEELGGEQPKKPLIAKWKTGVNKLQVSCSESDELVEGLSRAQRRLEDQRGTEINFELPDFLKDKDGNEQAVRQMSRNNGENSSRFYVESPEDPSPKRIPNLSRCNYENRSIIAKDFNNLTNNNNSFTNHNQNKLNNLRIYSPNKLSSDESSKSNQSTPSKCSSLENTVIENRRESPRCVEPPPLPPKPKIVPIKPPNWGQNGFYKPKELTMSDRNKALYLEQPSSSFV